MLSGKSGCLTDEASVSRTPNLNTGDTYHNYKIHTLTFVSATNYVPCIPYLSSLSPSSGAADVS